MRQIKRTLFLFMNFRNLIYSTTSAIGLVISVFYIFPFLGMVCLVPLLITFNNSTSKEALTNTILFNLIYCLFLFSWMLFSSAQFTGSIYYGLIGMLVSIAIFTALFTSFFFIWHKLNKGNLNWQSIVSLSCIFTFFEFLCDQIFKTLPWYSLHFGNPLIGSIYTIQFAETGGIYILTFFFFLINGAISLLIVQRKRWAISALLIVVFFTSNYILYKTTDQYQGDPIKLIC